MSINTFFYAPYSEDHSNISNTINYNLSIFVETMHQYFYSSMKYCSTRSSFNAHICLHK